MGYYYNYFYYEYTAHKEEILKDITLGGEYNEEADMYVERGGKVYRIKVYNDCLLTVNGYAEDVDVRGGEVHISKNGVLAKSHSWAGITIFESGKLEEFTVIDGSLKATGGNLYDTVQLGGTITVDGSATADHTVIKGGEMKVYSTAYNTTVSGGDMYVYGTATNTTVTGGILHLHKKHTGTISVSGSGRIIANGNTVITMTVNNNAKNSYIINNMAKIEGTHVYYDVSVKESQGAGKYKLAANSNLTELMVQISNTGFLLQANGAKFKYKERYYYLQKEGSSWGNLHLIIKANPAKPTVKASTTKLTNQNVTLSGKAAQDTTLQYSTDNKTWNSLPSNSFTATSNGTYYFRVFDNEITSLISSSTKVTVKNIDKTKPTLTYTANVHEKKYNIRYTVSAKDASGIKSVQYKLNNGNWTTFDPKKALKITQNGYLYIKAIDKAGNETTQTVNINFIAAAPKNNWTDLKSKGDASAELNKNIAYTSLHHDFTVTGWVGIDDDRDYHKIELYDAGKYFFDLSADDKTKFTIYKLVSKTKRGVTTYSLKSLQSTTLKKPKNAAEYSALTKGLLLEEGTYYISMTSTNAKSGGGADYTISVNSTSSIYYEQSNEGNVDDWTDMKTKGAASTSLLSGDISNINGWVGFGDAVDYCKITLAEAGKYSFDLSADDKTKFTIYKLVSKTKRGVTTYSLKSLQSTTLKKPQNAAEYSALTKGLLLEEGTYYIAMTSTNAKSGGNANYSIAVNNSSSIYYTASNDGAGDDLTNLKTAGITLGDKDKYTVSSANKSMQITDWVGFGDNVDYKELTLDGVAVLNFAVNASDKTKFTIYKLVSKTKNGVTTYSLKSLQSTTLKKPKNETEYSAITKNLLLDDGTYYIAMTSTNAKSGGNASYSINLNYSEFRLTEVQKSMSDNSDDSWKKAVATAPVTSVNNWVGYGDSADYFKFEANDSGKIYLDCSEETLAALKAKEIKISCLNSKGKSVSMTLSEDLYISKKNISAGTYYLGVQCTNVKKYATEYDINITIA